MSCTGDGDCLRQQDDGGYDGSTHGNVYCEHQCVPAECGACQIEIPGWVVRNDRCMNCDMMALPVGLRMYERRASEFMRDE